MPAPSKRSRYWQRPKDAPTHPYVEFEGTELWRIVKKALSDLERNQDIELKEWHQYVVGYICKQVSKGSAIDTGKKEGKRRANKPPEAMAVNRPPSNQSRASAMPHL